MTQQTSVLIGGAIAGQQLAQPGGTGNRHGLIAGATGTGKTVTLQILAEGYARLGVPVFLADVKGDLSGLAQPAKSHKEVDRRLSLIGIKDYRARGYPVVFWDLHGERGHPIRTTVSEIGPLLLANLLELNDVQEGVLYACFKIADDNGLLLLDLKDLRSLLSHVAENAAQFKHDYGNLSPASIGAIQRDLLVLDEQGADRFFGEPALDLADLMKTDFSGNGVISILDATRLMRDSPRVYSTLLLWLISELFEDLPEVGDPEIPRLVFFFDEAHLLFDSAPKPLIDKIEQVVRLIRSKGVGIYFVTQSPLDIPDEVLGQLGLRIQHALRAFTPRDQKAVRAAADTFRGNPAIDTRTAITELGIGEALVSVLDTDGSPTPVERLVIRPPESRIGPLTDEERAIHLSRSPLKGRYDQPVDRHSAYESLKESAAKRATEEAYRLDEKNKEKRSSNRQTVSEAFIKSAARSIGSQLGRQLWRGLLGTLFGKSR